MKIKPALKISALPFLVLGAGGVGLVLRVMLYTLGEDSRGLLPRYHALHVLTLLLTLCVTAVLVLTVKKLDGSNRYRKNFPASTPVGLANFFAAAWLLMSAFSILNKASETLEYLLAALAFCSVVSMGCAGYCRMKGKRPFFLFHSVICLFFAFNMVCRYRSWSANPQLPDYCFHLFACVFLTLSAYYRAAFDVGMGRRRMHLFCSLMAVYLCFLSLVGSGDGRFYFSGGIWALANLCPLEPPARRQKQDTIRIPTIPERS